VRRSAQDDDFVGVLKKNIPNKLALMWTQSWEGNGTRPVLGRKRNTTSPGKEAERDQSRRDG
jgi:hypothetical protein